MTDWRTLGIDQTQDKTEVYKALVRNVKEIDFDNNIEQVFTNLRAYLNIDKQFRASEERIKGKKPLPAGKSSESEAVYRNPQELISRFEMIYSEPMMRFDLNLWRFAIASAKEHSEVEYDEYCQPIVEFLSKNVLLTSEILGELMESFPFMKLFRTKEWQALKEKHNPYGYVEYLLMRGNFELDLGLDSLAIYQYDREGLDMILGSLSQSAFLIRKGDPINAFNVLTKIPDEIKPLIVWQRMLNILYRAVVIEKQEQPRDLFASVLHECLQRFPDNKHIMYVRSALMYETRPAESAKKDIIHAILVNPTNIKCFYLLGKCYLKMKSFDNAHTIFKNLFDLDPRNMEYAGYAAVAIDGLREQQAKADIQDRDRNYYKKRIIQLLDLHIYDEIHVPTQYESEPDFKALLLYAKASEQHYYDGITEQELLQEALEYAREEDIVLRILHKLFEFYPQYADLAKIKDLIFKYLEQYPDDCILNHNAGNFYYAQKEYEKALDYYEKAKSLDPQNSDVYYSIGMAAEQVKDYPKAVEAIRIFLQEFKYNATGHDILGCCLFNMGNYYEAYECFSWLVQIRKPAPTANDQCLLLRSLENYIQELDDQDRQTSYIKDEINQTINLFDTLEKEEQFRNDGSGRSAYYYAAKLCKQIDLHEKGLAYIDEAIQIWTSQGNKNLGAYAGMKADFMIALGKYQEAVDFLTPYVAYLESFHNIDHWNLSTCCYHMAVANVNLNNEEEIYRWEHKTIDHYASMENYNMAWLEDYIFKVFDKCVMFNHSDRIIETGHKYCKHINEASPNHLFVSYWMAKTYEELGDHDNAQKYYQDGVKYGEQFPGYYEELLSASENSLIN